MKSVEIVCCYAHEDQSLLNELKVHLRPLQRLGLITLWNDTDVSPGVDWKEEISNHLDTADIILLLVSPDFIGSDYCYDIEVQKALERHEQGEISLIPVILRPCDWQNTPLGKLQALPSGAKPVKSWDDQDEAFQDVVKGVRKIVKERLKERSPNLSNDLSLSLDSVNLRNTSNNVSRTYSSKILSSHIQSWFQRKRVFTVRDTEEVSSSSPPTSPSNGLMPSSRRRWLYCPSLLLIVTVTVLIGLTVVSSSFLAIHQKLGFTNHQDTSKNGIEVSSTNIQSATYALPDNPEGYTPDTLPKKIAVLPTDGQESTFHYHLVLELQNRQQGRFGITIEEVRLVILQVLPVPRPLNVWSPISLMSYEGYNHYIATYAGQSKEASLKTKYQNTNPNFKGYFAHLDPEESDEIDIHMISRVAANIQFLVQIIYRFDNKPQHPMLQLSQTFQIIFANPSDWHLYYLQDNGHFGISP